MSYERVLSSVDNKGAKSIVSADTQKAQKPVNISTTFLARATWIWLSIIDVFPYLTLQSVGAVIPSVKLIVTVDGATATDTIFHSCRGTSFTKLSMASLITSMPHGLDTWNNENSLIKRASRGWTALSHRSCIDPTCQSHTLDPIPEVPFPKLSAAIQLLIKDNIW